MKTLANVTRLILSNTLLNLLGWGWTYQLKQIPLIFFRRTLHCPIITGTLPDVDVLGDYRPMYLGPNSLGPSPFCTATACMDDATRKS